MHQNQNNEIAEQAPPPQNQLRIILGIFASISGTLGLLTAQYFGAKGIYAARFDNTLDEGPAASSPALPSWTNSSYENCYWGQAYATFNNTPADLPPVSYNMPTPPTNPTTTSSEILLVMFLGYCFSHIMLSLFLLLMRKVHLAGVTVEQAGQALAEANQIFENRQAIFAEEDKDASTSSNKAASSYSEPKTLNASGYTARKNRQLTSDNRLLNPDQTEISSPTTLLPSGYSVSGSAVTQLHCEFDPFDPDYFLPPSALLHRNHFLDWLLEKQPWKQEETALAAAENDERQPLLRGQQPHHIAIDIVGPIAIPQPINNNPFGAWRDHIERVAGWGIKGSIAFNSIFGLAMSLTNMGMAAQAGRTKATQALDEAQIAYNTQQETAFNNACDAGRRDGQMAGECAATVPVDQLPQCNFYDPSHANSTVIPPFNDFLQVSAFDDFIAIGVCLVSLIGTLLFLVLTPAGQCSHATEHYNGTEALKTQRRRQLQLRQQQQQESMAVDATTSFLERNRQRLLKEFKPGDTIVTCSHGYSFFPRDLAKLPQDQKGRIHCPVTNELHEGITDIDNINLMIYQINRTAMNLLTAIKNHEQLPQQIDIDNEAASSSSSSVRSYGSIQ